LRLKWLKSIPDFWPKWLKKHTLWGRTYLYSPYNGVSPSPQGGRGVKDSCKGRLKKPLLYVTFCIYLVRKIIFYQGKVTYGSSKSDVCGKYVVANQSEDH